jgi:hypothetical protein
VSSRELRRAGFKDAAEFRLLGKRNLSAEINAKREPDGTSCSTGRGAELGIIDSLETDLARSQAHEYAFLQIRAYMA